MSREPTRARSTPRRTRLEAIAKIALSYGLLLWLWFPALGSDRVNNSFQDWSYAAEYKSYAITAVFDFGEIPYFAWQRRHQGHRTAGFDAFFANPETSVLSPLLPLYRVLDYESATRAERAIRLLLGALGAYVLLAAWLTRVPIGSLIVFCLLYFGSGAVAGHTLVGHGMAHALFALPLALGLFLRAAARGETRLVAPAALGCGAVLALMVYEGASHFLTHFVLFLIVYSGFVCALDRSRARATLAALVTALISFALLGAFKLLPMIELYAGYAADYRMGYDSLRELVQQFQPFSAQIGFEHERNSYIGVVGASLFAASLLRWTRRTAPLLLTGLVFLLLTWLPLADWLQRSVPFFETQGAVSRFRIGFLVAFACVSAELVDRAAAIVAGWTSRAARVAALGVAALLLIGLAADLRQQNFELRRELLLRDPYPILRSATIAALPFEASQEGIEIQSLRGGINWAEYDYRTQGPANPSENMFTKALPHGAGQLRFSGDVRVESGPSGLALYPTRPKGTFGYRYHHPAAVLGGWISALSLALAAGLGLWRISQRRGARAELDPNAN